MTFKIVAIGDLKPNDRIRLISMPHDPNPVEIGTLGTILKVAPAQGLYGPLAAVAWDNGRTLSLVDIDVIERVEPELVN